MMNTKKQRVVGIDVARGIALIGMMAIHILPSSDENLQPTLTWTLLSGVSAGLFATLAGVSLTFASGGKQPLTGRPLTGAKAALAVRAGVIIAIGLVIAYLNPPAAIILAYYGVMFLLAIPLLGLGARTLFGLAVGFAVIGPVIMQAVRDYLPALDGYDPTFATLVTEPVATVSVLLVSGSYPAIPWMAYICAGLALGRLDLRSYAVQIRIALGGLALAVGAWLLSAVLVGPLGGRSRLLEATPGLGIEDLIDIQTFGPDYGLSTSSWWWLAILSPYSSTPLELLHTIGLAAAVLGALIILTARIGTSLMPLAVMGSMTLTLYSAHLVLLDTRLISNRPLVWLAVHVILAAIFAIMWRNVTDGKQGPLERLVAVGANAVRRRVLGQGSGRATTTTPEGSELDEVDPVHRQGADNRL